MATKNLARSVIEGGRSFYNSWERRESHRVARTHVREKLESVRRDPEELADAFFAPPRFVYKDFHDKLSPAYRFLDSRVGKSWNKTRAMIATRFDTRTTAGRHIVFDHMLADVAPNRASLKKYGRTRYFVDKRGILREVRDKRPRRVFETPLPIAWLANRKIGRMGTLLSWFVPTRDGTAFRQDRALDDSERGTFESLPDAVQRAILDEAPV